MLNLNSKAQTHEIKINKNKITNSVLSCHSSPLSGYMEDWWRPRKGTKSFFLNNNQIKMKLISSSMSLE